MARRNPRFAPEWLEKKLSPTSIAAPPALVANLDDPDPPPCPTHPGLPPSLPPAPTHPGLPD